MVQSKKQGKYMAVFMTYYVSSASACADPGIFTKCGGGGGWRVQAHLTAKSLDSVVCYSCCFFSPNLHFI